LTLAYCRGETTRRVSPLGDTGAFLFRGHRGALDYILPVIDYNELKNKANKINLRIQFPLFLPPI